MLTQETKSITETNIFLLSTSELSVLKTKLDKANQEKLNCEKKIEAWLSQLENKFLKKIPAGHNILNIINSKIENKGGKTILRYFIEGVFDREKMCIHKVGYTVKIFSTMMPVVINPQDLLGLVEELNIFWFSNLKLEIKIDSPYIYFNFTWL